MVGRGGQFGQILTPVLVLQGLNVLLGREQPGRSMSRLLLSPRQGMQQMSHRRLMTIPNRSPNHGDLIARPGQRHIDKSNILGHDFVLTQINILREFLGAQIDGQKIIGIGVMKTRPCSVFGTE